MDSLHRSQTVGTVVEEPGIVVGTLSAVQTAEEVETARSPAVPNPYTENQSEAGRGLTQ